MCWEHGSTLLPLVRLAVFDIIEFIRLLPQREGVVNESSPNPTDNASMMASLRRVLGVRFGVPAQRSLAELSAVDILRRSS